MEGRSTFFDSFDAYIAFFEAIDLRDVEKTKEFVDMMSVEDVITYDKFRGDTALTFAATASGSEMIEIAACLIRKNQEILTTPNKEGKFPLVVACENGHKDMIYFLYSKMQRQFLLSDTEVATKQATHVISSCIHHNLFDIALDLVRLRPELGVKNYDPHHTPTFVLADNPSAFFSTNRLSFWQRWIYDRLKVNPPNASSDNEVRISIGDQDPNEMQDELLFHGPKTSNLLTKLPGIKKIYDLKVRHVYARELLLLMSKTISTTDVDIEAITMALFKAAEQGIKEFIVEITSAKPYLIWQGTFRDSFGIRSIIHNGVVHRQEKVFSLIYGMSAPMKDNLVCLTSQDGNNILHLAGKLTSRRLLDQIPGAALQMQRELQWFKEVENIVPHVLRRKINEQGKTPYDVFDESHEKLAEEGEKWMKDIAQSSMIVGTLIITIMFATLYTVPGGYDQDGTPLFLRRKIFKLFVVSDAVSLFTSSTSVLIFLDILTSRYAAKDFLTSLPTKLIIALSMLLLSIATMMIAFCSTVIIMLKGQLSFVIPIVLLASVPVSLFVVLQFPLLATIFRSTFGPEIFERKMKKWI